MTDVITETVNHILENERPDLARCRAWEYWMKQAWEQLDNDHRLGSIESIDWLWVANSRDKGATCPFCEYEIKRPSPRK